MTGASGVCKRFCGDIINFLDCVEIYTIVAIVCFTSNRLLTILYIDIVKMSTVLK